MARTTTPVFAGASLILDRSVRAQARLAWRLMRDERVTSLKFALPALVTLYLVSPVDTIPDLLLGVGQVDDLGIVIIALMILLRLIPKLAPDHVIDEHLREMGLTHFAEAAPSASAGQFVDARYSVRL